MALTTGRWAPASRFRVRELIPQLAGLGVHFEEKIPLVPAYPPQHALLRPAWLVAAVAARIPAMISSKDSDVVFFQRELVSTLLTLEPFFKKPRVLDVDDAIYLSQRYGSIEKLASRCDMIVCGNSHLAETFSRWNRNTRILPTGVDISQYRLSAKRNSDERQTIGWIGTSSNLRYLLEIENALARVLETEKCVDVVVVSDRKPEFRRLAPGRVRFVQWAPDIEPATISSFSVGVMPLADTEWARGKCSFKLLQYYACGVPAVVSPVGMNAQVAAEADAALVATSEGDWVDGLLSLLRDRREAERRGLEGRRLVERAYSLGVVAPQLAAYLFEVAGH